MRKRRSAEEIEQLLEKYRASGQTQIEFCRQSGIVLSTFGRYLRMRNRDQRLVRVNVQSSAEPESGFVLVLGNGRRIESGWRFGDGELARLIRVVESA
jgi:hypothetical protein